MRTSLNKILVAIAATTTMASAGWAQQISATNKADGTWKVDINASTNVIVGTNDELTGFDDLDVNVDRPFVMIRVTSPGGRLEFEGVFNTQALVSRSSTLNDVLPEHIVQELKAKYNFNPMLSVTAGYGSVTFGAGLEERGERAEIPLLSEQAKYSQIKQRLMAEVGMTLATGTTIQLAVFDGREATTLDPDASFDRKDLIDIDGGMDRLTDDPSFALTVRQQIGKMLGADLAVVASYAKVSNLTEGASDETRMALGVQASRNIGAWAVAALYQFVKVTDGREFQSHLIETTARKGKMTIFAKIEASKEDDAKKKSATLGASYALIKTSSYSLSPFVAVKAEKADGDEDISWGKYLGMTVNYGHQINLKKRTE